MLSVSLWFVTLCYESFALFYTHVYLAYACECLEEFKELYSARVRIDRWGKLVYMQSPDRP